ncbi:MAG: hypothetical protein JOZ90_01735 [Alphaproteobacteria bacterium]|nr:hypothetical protein [Alphaproteobacteria bacterium]MBV9370725.1 hypothetical protein [Alphaproteobacteria bacterium]MBV9899798.1 hypothetical protein [Alphaproteobacteria bacterium]
MRDEIDGRLWVEHHQAFSASVASFLGEVALGLRRLNEWQFEAPWQRRHGPPQA